ncbi:MAG: hypothetical protein J7466_06005 [Roseiflexus sp.]|jgi:Sec-independent protein translocase protein TatA|nr:hypothetical protein [Roseiflexus sp.]
MLERHHPLIEQLQRLATERWAWRAFRTILQSVSIAIGVWCIGMGARLLWNLEISVQELTAIALAIVGIALITLLRPPMRPTDVARRLDRRFCLNEQLATAVEMLQSGRQPSPMMARLLDQSTHTVQQVQRYINQHQKAPWTDLLTLLALVLVAGGLLLISGIGGMLLNPLVVSLPALPQSGTLPLPFPADDGAPIAISDQIIPLDPGEEMMPFRPGNTAGDQQPASTPAQTTQPPAADPRTLEALANALRDLGATRPVADALDRGNTAAAAQRLRELADQAGAMSKEARQALGRALQDAARTIEQQDPALARQVRQSARDIAGQQSAAQGLEELAQAIDRLGQSSSASAPPSNGPGEGQASTPGSQPGQPGADGANQQSTPGSAAGNNPSGEQRPIAPAGRLGVEGQPVTIEAQGSGQSAGVIKNPDASLQSGVGTVSGGESGTGGAIGADPLRIPLDERDVVQEYFQP